MSELVRAATCVKSIYPTKEEYEAKKQRILANFDRRTEIIFGGMIYCRFCSTLKVADFPERNFVVKCACVCEVEKWERDRARLLHPPKIKELRKGDWNPFDR